MLSQENDADRLVDDPDESGPIVQGSSLFIAKSCLFYLNTLIRITLSVCRHDVYIMYKAIPFYANFFLLYIYTVIYIINTITKSARDSI